ncbi:MAG: glutamine-hydrolyzing carbamoyl-phosphate synthase small subunit [Leptospiraceae bacterium]|nr:glutamine-hydrolyzing carbamoyl-phosphate synthase small subunit [Leptospiraceae bacterium]
MGLHSEQKAFLVLENGKFFEGRSFGGQEPCLGEVCFNTSMCGYQEILTDPSYRRQIVCLTYPMIGNYGTCAPDNESSRIQVSGLIVKEYNEIPSAYHSEASLAEFLRAEGIPGIEGLDTRMLVRIIRTEGAMRGGIFVAEDYKESMLHAVRAIPVMTGLDVASEVSTTDFYQYGDPAARELHVAVLDFGVKNNILRLLDQAGFGVHVFPAKSSLAQIESRAPHPSGFDAFFLSNGPGDPEPLDYAIRTIQSMMETGRPVFGICLGHQLIGLASQHKSYKLKFGHRGGNQPVMNRSSGRVEITAQNHGFAIEPDSVQSNIQVTHHNLNDDTVEGFSNQQNMISVQYHPEAAPGPNDSAHLFQQFFEMARQGALDRK